VVPAAGRPTFSLPVGEMEIGMGIHGNLGAPWAAGASRRDRRQLVYQIVGDLPYKTAMRSPCS